MGKKPAKGHKDERGWMKVAIAFPPDLFHKVNTRAAAEGKTFTAMVVDLCKCGNLDLEESDRLEPKPQGASLQ